MILQNQQFLIVKGTYGTNVLDDWRYIYINVFPIPPSDNEELISRTTLRRVFILTYRQFGANFTNEVKVIMNIIEKGDKYSKNYVRIIFTALL